MKKNVMIRSYLGKSTIVSEFESFRRMTNKNKLEKNVEWDRGWKMSQSCNLISQVEIRHKYVNLW